MIKPTRPWADLMNVIQRADRPVTYERAEKLVKDHTEDILEQVIERLQQEADNCLCTREDVAHCDCTGIKYSIRAIKALRGDPDV